MIIKAPGYTSKNTQCNQTVETVDLYPTLTDLADLKKKSPIHKLDGKSLGPIIKDSLIDLKDHIYHSYIRKGNLGEAIRDSRYRMVRWTNLTDKNKIEYELYDYKEDPCERINIAKERKKVLNLFLEKLNSYPAAKKPILK